MIAKAKEKWYVVFPNIKQKLPAGLSWESFSSWASDVQALSREDKITVWLSDGRSYDLTKNFEISSVYFDLLVSRHWKNDRSFPFDIVKEDKKNWKNIEVYKEGVRIR